MQGLPLLQRLVVQAALRKGVVPDNWGLLFDEVYQPADRGAGESEA